MIGFTCITGRYDRLREFHTPFPKICFTDQPVTSLTWKVQRIRATPKIFREIKICPHRFLPEHDRSVWIDGHLELIDLSILEGKTGFWLMQHRDRQCVYDELQACIEQKKDNVKTMTEQVNFYATQGYPKNNGLCATGVMIRDNNPEYYPILEAWWSEVKHKSVRDQLSFNYIAWKYNLQFQTFPYVEGFKKWRHRVRSR